ncbi:unnamed protein product [Vitrella brassicaformis CCMP3155]|uniref:Dolichol-phosphate mannosyltransferase subunit 1 n=1 Tax=Vitrella brassicaformis (strain CCMP3155) TaxID=1169540 RepID=A0A0G4EQF9_VITBC|nr:unnamed protein product [Vitrella brassicaformis CCMP3155]|eukprot:CEL99870.1 unnamed protein product [Vitrella brassicaformis CCMP3155]
MVEYSIILPTYNERDNLPLIIWLIVGELQKAGIGDWEVVVVVVVDDSSPDGTADVCRQLQRIYGDRHIRLHERPGKLGLGTAYRSGLEVAKGAFILLMDADLSHHPKFIPQFIAIQRTTQADIVTGTRYKGRGGGVYGWDMRRILTSRVANYLAQVMLSPGVSDLTGSFRLYRRAVFEEVISRVVSRGYVFQMELITRATKMGYTVAECPITFVDRIYGSSKLGAGEVMQYLRGLMLLFWTL